MNVFRGIRNALAISLVLWVLIGLAVVSIAEAHTLPKWEAADAIDTETRDWLAMRPAGRFCVRYTTHRVVCVVEHIRRPLLAVITVTLRGNTVYVGWPREIERY